MLCHKNFNFLEFQIREFYKLTNLFSLMKPDISVLRMLSCHFFSQPSNLQRKHLKKFIAPPLPTFLEISRLSWSFFIIQGGAFSNKYLRYLMKKKIIILIYNDRYFKKSLVLKRLKFSEFFGAYKRCCFQKNFLRIQINK